MISSVPPEDKREQEWSFRLIAENTSDVVFAYDMDRRLIYANPAVRELTGYSGDELRNLKLVDLVHREDQARVRQRWDELYSGTSHYGDEFRIVAKDGQVKWVESACGPLRDESGRQIGIQCRERDVTRHRHIQEELREANAELETYARTVAHDLGSPLNSIGAIAQILLERYGPAVGSEGEKWVRDILASVDRANSLIDDLLAYSQVSHEEISLERVKLGRVIDEVMGDLQAVTLEADAQIEVEGPFQEVVGHAATLRRAVANLLSNALKFVAPGVRPHVRVWAETTGNHVRLWVEDNGIGIAPEHHESVFKAFKRLHGEGVYTGTGVGLAIVKRAMERMGGRVGLESTPGQGSKFWLELTAAATNRAPE